MFREKRLPKASPPEVVADAFQEKVLPTSPSEVVASCVISRGTIIRNRITTKTSLDTAKTPNPMNPLISTPM